MKICHISSFYPPLIFGGAEIYVKRVSEKLAQHGNEVIVITTSPKISIKPLTEEINGVKIYRIHPINIYPIYNTLQKPFILKPIWYGIDLFNITSYKIIKNILIKEHPDIVHIHNFKGFSFSFQAVKSLNIPLIFTAHDYFIKCLKENLFRNSNKICDNPPLLCKFYAKIQKHLKNNIPDLFTAPSQFVIDKIKKDGFFQNTKSMKLELGIELDNEKIEKEYENIDILYVGRLKKYKGIHTLIYAFKELKYKNVKLHIVGEGEEKEKLQKIAKNDNIIFHGFVTDKELIELYNKSNISVVPSIWYETFGIVIIESFKYGTPVIASNIGGFPELVVNGYNGFLFEPENIQELKNKLEYLINNINELKKLSNNAFMSVKKYSMDNHITKLLKIYKDLDSLKRPGSGFEPES